MSSIAIWHYSSFTTQPGQGNPAGLVFEAETLTTAQMQETARLVGFNETTFLCSPTGTADLHLRYFTPGYEMDLCGHGTIGMISALCSPDAPIHLHPPLDVVVETRAGLLPMSIRVENERPRVRMRQATAKFRPFNGSRAELAAALGLDEEDLHPDLPVCYASTGNWTLLVPIRSLAAFARMHALNERFPALLPEMPRCSLHPFCLQTHDPAALLHGRHFSSAFAGTREDPVTGTDSGAMGAYYLTYVQPQSHLTLIVEQGHEIGRPGQVFVEVEHTSAGIQTSIEGTAVYEKKWEIALTSK